MVIRKIHPATKVALAAAMNLAALGACAEVGPPESTPGTPPASACGADRAAGYVGREATPAVRDEIRSKVGRRTIRWIGPNDAVTMDYSPTRLNMMLNARGVIIETRCG